MAVLPIHHARYAQAWALYQDKGMSDETYKALETEMDSAQNHFCFQEFQEFKKTLPGFVEHWAGLESAARAMLLDKFGSYAEDQRP